MMQRDVTVRNLTLTGESHHRDSFNFCILRNRYLVPSVKSRIIKPDRSHGRIDLLFQFSGRMIIVEWKFFRISFLDILINNSNSNLDLAKADALCNYKRDETLRLKFSARDRFHHGIIGSWAREHGAAKGLYQEH